MVRTDAPSKSQVNKAGRTLRRYMRGDEVEREKVEGAIGVLVAHRAAFQVPLTKATMGLRSMVKTEECRVDVSQRLKRTNTILDKLLREPTMQLGNMQDIGGCRAVLASIDELRRVEKRLRKRRPPLDSNDYILNPRESGYRGVHVIVAYDDRPIEVQLRTRVMHEWAIAVERLGGRLDVDLKSGRGPEPVLALLSVISEAMALEEDGHRVEDDLVSEMNRLRREAQQWIGG